MKFLETLGKIGRIISASVIIILAIAVVMNWSDFSKQVDEGIQEGIELSGGKQGVANNIAEQLDTISETLTGKNSHAKLTEDGKLVLKDDEEDSNEDKKETTEVPQEKEQEQEQEKPDNTKDEESVEASTSAINPGGTYDLAPDEYYDGSIMLSDNNDGTFGMYIDVHSADRTNDFGGTLVHENDNIYRMYTEYGDTGITLKFDPETEAITVDSQAMAEFDGFVFYKISDDVVS